LTLISQYRYSNCLVIKCQVPAHHEVMGCILLCLVDHGWAQIVAGLLSWICEQDMGSHSTHYDNFAKFWGHRPRCCLISVFGSLVIAECEVYYQVQQGCWNFRGNHCDLPQAGKKDIENQMRHTVVCPLGATCKAMKVSWLRLRLLSVQKMYNFNYEYLLVYCLTESFTTLCSLLQETLEGWWRVVINISSFLYCSNTGEHPQTDSVWCRLNWRHFCAGSLKL
jgi:hypothetical protein